MTTIPAPIPPYDYELITVRRVVDGDTVDLTVGRTIDFGFYLIEHKQFSARFRLAGVDTPERGQPGWAEAGDFVGLWLADREGIARVYTIKPDNFGRFLAVIYGAGGPADSLNQALLDYGYGWPYLPR